MKSYNYWVIEDVSCDIHFFHTFKKMMKFAEKLESAGISVTLEINVEI